MSDLYYISVRKYRNTLEFDKNTQKYPSECGELINSFTSKYESIDEVEYYISDYIKLNQGDSEYKYFFSIPSNGVILGDEQKRKYGFFIISDANSISKFTVYERKRFVGMVFNTYEDVKHFDISVQFLKNDINENKRYDCYNYFEYFLAKENYLDEILNIAMEADKENHISETLDVDTTTGNNIE